MNTTVFENPLSAALCDSGTAVDERRSATRTCGKVSVSLTAMGCPQGLHCPVEDLSENGLYVRVPAEYGLAVGKRVEVTFANQPDSPSPAALDGETCYATVIRTAALAEESSDMVGAGLRFDQPLFL